MVKDNLIFVVGGELCGEIYGEDNCDDVAFRSSSRSTLSLKSDTNVSGTKGQGGLIYINNTAARVAVSAEL